ncbi:MAG: NAD(P)/FAD-dependent oxidoreductase, partial [Oscillospiraceae bacterium]|nr:NAD(P)/FAD-dependent oxidoreductase [Oscillospiraceae bacterium]
AVGADKKYTAGGADTEKTDDVMLKRNRVSRIYYKGNFFDYHVSLKWETIKNMGFFTTMKAGFSYLAAVAHKKPETSLENFYINRFGRVFYSMFFEGYTEKLWGRHPRYISADWGSQRVKGLSIRAVIADMFGKIFKTGGKVETSLIEEYIYPKLGPGQLYERVRDRIEEMGGTVKMNCPVVKINETAGKINGVEYIENGERKALSGDIVISSMPVKDLIDAFTNPDENMKEIADGLPYRDFITVGLLVDKLKLKNKTNIKTVNNIVPDCWIYVQDTSVKLGRIQIFNNWSPYMVDDYEKHVWIGLEYFCSEGDEYWNMSDEAFIEFAENELEKIGVIDKKDVIDAHREKVKKAYPAYFDTYSRMGELVDYLNGYENLYCVGRNGQHRYNNMDHSMVTAFETVDAIMNGKKDKSPIWNVNTKEEYHETK